MSRRRVTGALGPTLLLLAGALGAAWGAASGGGSRDDAQSERTGGDTTVHASGKNAFSFPAAHLPDDERTRFAIGNSFFKRNWVEAPASARMRDGLGPHFIARSCGACHALDGRGAPPDFRRGRAHEPPVALLLRLSVPGRDSHRGPDRESGPLQGPVPDPVYGDQFNNAAVQGVKPEGRVTLRWQPVHGRFADGTRYTLHKPFYGFADLAYGPLAADVMVSPRIAPQLIGVGLLEAIPAAEIERNAREQAAAPGPVKGRINRVWDAFAQQTLPGRFGWKANVATLAHQTAGAFAGDIGITSSRFPDESCTPAQKDCLAAPRGAAPGQPEIDDAALADVVFYQAVLAPPARRNAGDARVRLGEQLFARAQCAACHRPSYITGAPPLAERFPRLSSRILQGQRIWPYTDLLLHDMGEALADGRPDFLAHGRQWKTPPLWGIGLLREVNGHTRLLHDGRADGVLEAILWHGGEAEASRQQVLRMKKTERDALVKFVESL